jgi:hypothetical protein
VRGPAPHVAAGPPADKAGLTAEQQAGEQLVAALVSKKAGGDVPHWVVAGFARATAWRASPAAYATERNRVRTQARNRHARDVLGTGMKPEEAAPWRASVMDYLAYGARGETFTGFLEGFKPEEEDPRRRTRKTAWDALKAVKLSPDKLNQGWQAWVAGGK